MFRIQTKQTYQTNDNGTIITTTKTYLICSIPVFRVYYDTLPSNT